MHARVWLIAHPVGCHQHSAVEGQAGVHDLVGALRRCLSRDRGLGMRDQVELAAQRAFVETHRVGAVVIEKQVGVELVHGNSSFSR